MNASQMKALEKKFAHKKHGNANALVHFGCNQVFENYAFWGDIGSTIVPECPKPGQWGWLYIIHCTRVWVKCIDKYSRRENRRRNIWNATALRVKTLQCRITRTKCKAETMREIAQSDEWILSECTFQTTEHSATATMRQEHPNVQ